MVARKPDSHDICFIPDGDTARFVTNRIGVRRGSVVDAVSGAVLGEHSGAHAFTIGQRRGLGIASPDGTPVYVVDIDSVSQTVRVGPPEMLDVHVIEASRATWTGAPLGPGPHDVTAQMRAHGEPITARASFDGSTVRVHLVTPIRGLAAGQQVVLYEGDRVLGSATVDATERAA
jgi:tRNA-specific 2-thiouridylase